MFEKINVHFVLFRSVYLYCLLVQQEIFTRVLFLGFKLSFFALVLAVDFLFILLFRIKVFL